MSAAVRARKLGEISEVKHLETLRENLETIVFNFRNQGHLVASKYDQYLDQLNKHRPNLGLTGKGREYLYQIDIYLETLGLRVARVVEIDRILKDVSAAFAVLRRAEIAWSKSLEDIADRAWLKAQKMSGFLKGDFTDHPELIEYAERFRAFKNVMTGRESTLPEYADSLLEEYLDPKERRGMPRPITAPIKSITAAGGSFGSGTHSPYAASSNKRVSLPTGTKASKSSSSLRSNTRYNSGSNGSHGSHGGKYGHRSSHGDDHDSASSGESPQRRRGGFGLRTNQYVSNNNSNNSKNHRQQTSMSSSPSDADSASDGFDSDTAGGSSNYSYSYYSEEDSAGGTTQRTARSRRSRKSARGRPDSRRSERGRLNSRRSSRGASRGSSRRGSSRRGSRNNNRRQSMADDDSVMSDSPPKEGKKINAAKVQMDLSFDDGGFGF